MSEAQPVELTEDRIPFEGIEAAVDELVELYGGSISLSEEGRRRFKLPLRRGFAASGMIECTLSWKRDDDRNATVTLHCDRNVDAPKLQRVLLLLAGAIGAVLFMLWPFFPGENAFGSLAWIGGVMAIAVYLLTLRRTGGGIAYDFLQRLARAQRATE